MSSKLLAIVSLLLCFVPRTHAQQTTPMNSGQPAQNPSQPNAPIPPAARNAGRASSTTNLKGTGAKLEHAIADPADLPPLVPSGRPAIGIALEGGGALGLAHIGVLKWLEEHHIPIDRVAGTSMGALVGSFYASGISAPQLETIATDADFGRVFTVGTAYTDLSFRRKQDSTELPQAIQIGLKGGPSLRNSLLTDGGLNDFLRANLETYNRDGLDYNKLPIPFRCIATDLTSLNRVVFDAGPLPQSVRASISIPGIFAPVALNGSYLVDGAIVDNLPVDIARQDLHADVVIGVHLGSVRFGEGDVSSIVGVFARAYAAGTARNEDASKALADVLVTVDTAQFSTNDYDKAKGLIALGYAAAEKSGPALKHYALSEDGWKSYIASRQSRIRPSPGRIEMASVEGGSIGAQQRTTRALAPLMGKPLVDDAVARALRAVQGSGSYNATFQTFSPGHPQPTDGAGSFAGPDTGVLVRLDPVRNGPPFLLVGPDITAVTSNVTRNSLDFRLIDQDLGGFGSELRADVRVGFLTQLSGEYYRRLTPSGYFLQPHLGILREPVYLWANQRRISERFSQQAGGGLDFGRTVSRNLQVAAEWRAQVIRWHLTSGTDADSNLSGTAQSALFHLRYDSTESGTVSPRGSRIDLAAGALYSGPASQRAPLLTLGAGKTYALFEKNIVGLSVDADTYFHRNVSDPLRFTMGGPLRLSASSIDEYRGTDDYIARAGYLRQIASLPSGLGQGLYLTLAYEAGEIWSPERPAVLRQDGLLGVVAATPLGAIKFGGSIGDAGRRKVFFSLGRLF